MDALSPARAVILACWPGTDPLLAGIGVDPALFEVAGKPMVQRAVEQAVALGARRVDVVLGDDAAPYPASLGNGERWGCTIAYHYAPLDAVIPPPLARQLAREPDCLLLRGDTLLPHGACPEPATFGDRRGHAAPHWSGWARLPGRVLVALADSGHSSVAMARALAADPRLQPRHGEAALSAESAVALLEAARSLLRSPDYPIGIARRPVRDGLWLGNGVRIHPTAKVIAPAYLGDDVLVGEDAVVGPDAVIGSGSIIDRAAIVADSLVGPASYVGAGIELRQAILSGRRLVNVAMGVQLDIADRELAGAAAGGRGPLGPGVAERLLAGLLWCACGPLRPAVVRAMLMQEKIVGRMADESGDAVAAIQCGTRGAWVRHFRDAFCPGLVEVVRGRGRIVGPLPVPVVQAGLGATCHSLDPASQPGLLNEALFLGPEGADPALRFAADTLATRKLHFVHIAGAVLRYARAVLADWRSLRSPPGRAAPNESPRPPAQAVPTFSRDA